tara:strand:+ start:1284 stop:1736 length:453 start_codon:yes stop_codon:yes gene_type:complete|eukprot:scaffold84493_cov63-Phaeocystis_antarctica.AAC.4
MRFVAWPVCPAGDNTSWNVPNSFTAGQLGEYAHGVSRLLRHLQNEFPRSAVAWRTCHPAFKRGRGVTPATVELLNDEVRARAPGLGVPVVDVGQMMARRPIAAQPYIPRSTGGSSQSRGAPGTEDGSHLVPWLEVPVINLLLNALETCTD